MDDLIIRGGDVIDGTGGPRRRADVVVSAGRIVEVAPDSVRSARRVIDALGQVVAPGFIDIHAHSDFTLPINPRAESKIRQGVTTEVVGNCGYSVAPALPGTAPMLKEYLSHSAPWLTFRDTTFQNYVETYPETSVNIVHLVGHHTLRLMTIGMEPRAARPGELQKMVALLEEALDAGAAGMSSGLFTAPGSFADREEIYAFGRVLARRNGRYFTHVRDESIRVFEAVREAIDVARQTGVRTQIAHLKLAGMDSWGRADELLELIEQARSEGVPVECDQHPYAMGSFPLRNFLPTWVHEGGINAMVERLRDADVRARLRADIERDGLVNTGRLPSWDVVKVSISPSTPELQGRSLGEIARERRRDAFDQVCDCIIADRQMRILMASLDQSDVDAITAKPWVLVGSDGNSLAVHGVTSQGMPHPRFYGSHARVLGHCVRGGLLTLEQAIYKMTGGSAAALGWTDRGWIREGYCADIAIFDPARVSDHATYEQPHQYATGVTTVVVNGTVVIDEGEHTGTLPGRVLKRPQPH
ncbi:MAG: D-aminoacylase [Burkholderiaceae bacterium]|nr:D-aminoacylase [Burkholderiaceae bacterium]